MIHPPAPRGPVPGGGPFRPEAATLLGRWAEPALALGLAAGLLWTGGRAIWRVGALAGWPGWLLVALGAASLMWFRAAFAHARLSGSRPGPGVVQIDERRISYFGPHGGAVLALASLGSIHIESGPAPVWVLRQLDGSPLRIPAGAEGADVLPEAFAALDGFSPTRAVAALAAPGVAAALVWRR